MKMPVLAMEVVFYKEDDGRLCGWRSAPPKRRRFQGTTMASGRDLPHDLAQFVVEATLGLDHGFWGLLAKGATFKSVPGRRRTQPGQQLVRAHREELDGVERLVNAHVTAWRTGAVTPLAPALETMLARWRALRGGEELRLVWRTRSKVARRTAGIPSGSSSVRR
ncbi:MAG TPA: hypothetical protein VIK51_01880 [Vicinamibacteria bacterium]|jgi:hypothetical protein